MCTHGFGGSIELADGVATLTLQGEADLASRAEFEKVIADVLDTAAPRIVIDVARLSYLESACLRSLLHAHTAAEHAGRSLTVRGAAGIVRRVLEIAGVAELLAGPDGPDAAS